MKGGIFAFTIPAYHCTRSIGQVDNRMVRLARTFVALFVPLKTLREWENENKYRRVESSLAAAKRFG